MIGINSNINSLVAQQNLNSTQSALSSAITRLSSGKRINSAADDAAGQAIASRMTSQINGLNQGVSNANDGVSMTQTAASGLSQISDNLQRIRQLAVQASSGSLSSSDQASLQKEVTQRIAEVNRIASQTTYNGTNVLDGSAGTVSFQVGANVGQTIGIDLSNGVSAAQLGGGLPQKGATIGTLSGLSLTSAGAATTGTAKADITSINVLADGKGGFTFTDQNNQALSSAATTALFSGTTTGTGTALSLTAKGALVGASTTQTAAIKAASAANVQTTTTTYAAADTKLGATIALDSNGLLPDLSGAGTGAATDITGINVYADGNGGYKFKTVANGTESGSYLSTADASKLFTQTPNAGGVATLTGTALTTTTGGADQTDITAVQNDAANVATATTTSPTTKLGSVSISLKADGTVAGSADTPAYSSVNIYGDGAGGFTFKGVDANGAETDISASVTGLFDTTGGTLTGKGALADNANATGAADGIAQANAQNVPPKVSDIDLTKANGANLAIESIDNALDSVNSIQADLGAAQNRFSSIASTQTAQSTNLSSAQSQITDANFAQETANLSKAQVLQQAGISVLAQANSMPQQVLKLLG
ncbi:flagellin [Caballeronia sp. LZ032]|uniref:flagellin N-terminal helical domain-containing protein n=1 Tax=Caballeronia sp. LZ032 TaxID=3038565 RepID=UPI0028598EA0|nr:flagellin [Caballeronia sp. LZ032]MDR5876771.1 flagellin [Caballeronia sp. LZ032]